MSALEISRMLTLSTAHLRVGTLTLMDGNDIDGIVLWPKGEYGYFVWVPDAGMNRERHGNMQVAFEYPNNVPHERERRIAHA